MKPAEKLYHILMNEHDFRNAKGSIKFILKDHEILVKQNNIVGNLIEEWLASWMQSKNIPHIYNHGQSSPDFWMNPENKNDDWMELKSFYDNPNFDVANFLSYISLIVKEPYRLYAKYICHKLVSIFSLQSL